MRAMNSDEISSILIRFQRNGLGFLTAKIVYRKMRDGKEVFYRMENCTWSVFLFTDKVVRKHPHTPILFRYE